MVLLTLTVSQSFETDEKTLRREFENYGPVKNIAMIKDSNTGKPRGYAFIEFERERDRKLEDMMGKS